MDDLLKNNNLITINEDAKNDLKKQGSMTTVEKENNPNMVDNTKNKLVKKNFVIILLIKNF